MKILISHIILALGLLAASLGPTRAASPPLPAQAPAVPLILVGQYVLPPNSAGQPSAVFGGAIEEGYAYLLFKTEPGNERWTLAIVDVRDPAAPVLRGRYDATFGTRMSLMQVVDGRAYLFLDTTFTILDVRNPAQPTVLGSYTPPSTPTVYGAAIAGTLAYVATTGSILYILDVSQPTQIRLLGQAPISSRGLMVDGDRLYRITNGFVIYQIDPANPLNLTKRGSYFLTGQALWGLDVADQRAFLGLAYFTGRPGTTGGMSIVDVSNPDMPVKVVDYELPYSQFNRSSCGYVLAVGGLAYLSCAVDDDDLRLYILNVSDPARIGVWNTVDGATAAIAADRYIYTINGADGLKILRFDLPRSFFLPLVGRSPA